MIQLGMPEGALQQLVRDLATHPHSEFYVSCLRLNRNQLWDTSGRQRMLRILFHSSRRKRRISSLVRLSICSERGFFLTHGATLQVRV